MQNTERLTVEKLSHDGRGIARDSGKATFITGALPGESVTFRKLRGRSKLAEAVVETFDGMHSDRIRPKCKHFLQCGGCNLQHLSPSAELEFKQSMLLEILEHQVGLKHTRVLEPTHSESFHYRTKARLGVKYVPKKGTVLVGFRELINPRLITEIESCAVLDPRVGEKIEALQDLISTLSIKDQVPQIEVAMGEIDTALIIRHLAPFSIEDENKLVAFAINEGFQIYLQPKGPDTIHPLYPEAPKLLSYTLPNHDLNLRFRPSDFTQVNLEINRKLVDRAIELLALDEEDEVLDLFCGLGNFTLAIAKQVKHVTGVEGSKSMSDFAASNALYNSIQNVSFHAFDLTKPLDGVPWVKAYDKLLIDPPRSGAREIVESIRKFSPKRIVYVSCNPTTLARDAAILVSKGYKMTNVGIFNMFPNTSHVESIACFELK